MTRDIHLTSKARPKFMFMNPSPLSTRARYDEDKWIYTFLCVAVLVPSDTFSYNSEGPFHGRARYHAPPSLLISSMESGDLTVRANYLSAPRQVAHIQNLAMSMTLLPAAAAPIS